MNQKFFEELIESISEAGVYLMLDRLKTSILEKSENPTICSSIRHDLDLAIQIIDSILDKYKTTTINGTILQYDKDQKTMDKPWCMCAKLDTVARDGWSTCSKCDGKDAYGTSKFRPEDKQKKILE
jgi:hypothetical protein